jgi:hypothetical protein
MNPKRLIASMCVMFGLFLLALISVPAEGELTTAHQRAGSLGAMFFGLVIGLLGWAYLFVEIVNLERLEKKDKKGEEVNQKGGNDEVSKMRS